MLDLKQTKKKQDSKLNDDIFYSIKAFLESTVMKRLTAFQRTQ